MAKAIVELETVDSYGKLFPVIYIVHSTKKEGVKRAYNGRQVVGTYKTRKQAIEVRNSINSDKTWTRFWNKYRVKELFV